MNFQAGALKQSGVPSTSDICKSLPVRLHNTAFFTDFSSRFLRDFVDSSSEDKVHAVSLCNFLTEKRTHTLDHSIL